MNESNQKNLKNFSAIQIEDSLSKALEELTGYNYEVELVNFQIERTPQEVKISFYARITNDE